MCSEAKYIETACCLVPMMLFYGLGTVVLCLLLTNQWISVYKGLFVLNLFHLNQTRMILDGWTICGLSFFLGFAFMCRALCSLCDS